MKFFSCFSRRLSFQFVLISASFGLVFSVAFALQFILISSFYRDIHLKSIDLQLHSFVKQFEKAYSQTRSIQDLSQKDRSDILSLLNSFSHFNGHLIVSDGSNYLTSSKSSDIDVYQYLDQSKEYNNHGSLNLRNTKGNASITRYYLPNGSLQLIHLYNSDLNDAQFGNENRSKLLILFISSAFVLFVCFYIYHLVYVYRPYKFFLRSTSEILSAIEINDILDFKRRDNISFLASNYKFVNSRVSEIISKILNFRKKQLILTRGISHEISKPLMLARHNLRLGLQKRISYDQALSKADEITKSAQSIVKNLAMLNKLSFRKRLHSKRIISINSFANQFISDLPFDSSDHSLHSVVEENAKKMSCYVDEALLVQSLRIIVDNSIKYSPKHSKIQIIYSYRQPNYIQIVVIDNGVGIPTSEWNAVFEPFVRGKNNYLSLSKFTGSGIGLALARILVEDELDGKINIVTPHQHKGTWIQILIPVFRTSQ